MKIPREWMEERQMFDRVVEALDEWEMEDKDFQVYAYAEEDFYGEKGSIEIVLGERRFALNLSEIK
jgi:hypothetical protein